MVFELLQIEVQCSKNYFKILLPQEGGTFGKNRKRIAKAIVQIWKNIYIICLQKIFSLPSIQCKW